MMIPPFDSTTTLPSVTPAPTSEWSTVTQTVWSSSQIDPLVGETEIHLKSRGQTRVVARLGPGQYFGEVELLRMSSRAIASVKAALHSAVEVLTLDGPIFAELMDEAHAMREAIEQVVSSRLAQNALWFPERGAHAQTALA